MSNPIVLSRKEALHLYEALRWASAFTWNRHYAEEPTQTNIDGKPLLQWGADLLLRHLYLPQEPLEGSSEEGSPVTVPPAQLEGELEAELELDDDSGMGWTGDEDLENRPPTDYDPTI